MMNTRHNGNGIGDPPGRSGAKHGIVLRNSYFAPFTPPGREIPFFAKQIHAKRLTANGEHLTTRLLEKVAQMALNSCPEHGRREEDNQDQNNQEFLDFLNTATAQMRVLLEKQSRLRRTPIKAPLAEGR